MTQRLARDFKFAWRGLRRTKAFTVTVVLTLTIGIAATTVMFALIQGVLLRPLPVRDQDRVVVAWKELRASQFAHYPFGGPDVDVVERDSDLVERAAGVTSNGAFPWVAVENGGASYVNGALVTGGFFDVLGIEALLGRPLTATDDLDGAEPVVVISHALWHRRYNGSRDVLGRKVRLGDVPFTIVGVMPRGLSYPRGVEVWRTVRSVPSGGTFGDAARYEVDLIARMKPGVSSEQLRGALQALTARLASTAPADFPRDLVPVVRSIEDVIVGEVRGTMLLMFAAVGLVLLVSSANAANLLLMRAGERRREVAVRAALGAGRGSIASQLLTESLLLALAAGAAGLALAWASLGALVAALPATLPRTESVLIDARVVLFAMCTAFVTALLTGFPPAASSTRADLVSHLRKAGNGSHGATGRRMLAAAQVAFGVIVVALAGLLTRSVFKLQSAPTGMAADRLVFVDLSLPLTIVKERTRHEQFLETLMTRLSAAPFIRAATPVNVAPFSGDGGWDVPRFTAEGQSPERASANPSLNLESVFPTYFDTFGITIVRGRSFTPEDRAAAPAVAIVSDDVAARTWPGENPLGKRLKMGGADSEDGWRIVVGVAAPTRYREVAHPRATLYLPAAQFLMTARIVVVQSTAPSDLLASTVRAHVAALEPGAQVVKVTPYEDSRRIALAHPRFYALVLGVFGVTALVLATIGLYGVINAHVSGRSREIAIRVAVGASMSTVRRLVLREAFALASVGAAAGLAGAVATTRYARTILFELHPLDPLTLASAALALIGAAAVAAYVPMRRALRLDPAIMLRAE